MKQLTLATEDSKYGVKLQAEPDNERLGKRLKENFKRVAPAVKALTSEQLVAFQEEGKIEVEGHELTAEDIKVVHLDQCSLYQLSHQDSSAGWVRVLHTCYVCCLLSADNVCRRRLPLLTLPCPR